MLSLISLSRSFHSSSRLVPLSFCLVPTMKDQQGWSLECKCTIRNIIKIPQCESDALNANGIVGNVANSLLGSDYEHPIRLFKSAIYLYHG